MTFHYWRPFLLDAENNNWDIVDRVTTPAPKKNKRARLETEGEAEEGDEDEEDDEEEDEGTGGESGDDRPLKVVQVLKITS